MALRFATDSRLTCLKWGDKQTLVRSAIDAKDPSRTSEANLQRAAQWLLEGAVYFNMTLRSLARGRRPFDETGALWGGQS
jgi:hypothetical protein